MGDNTSFVTGPPAYTPADISRIFRQAVKKPDEYDGTRKNFQKWWNGVQLWLRGFAGLEDSAQIIAVLSFMNKGEAQTWAQLRTDEVLAGTLTELDVFIAQLKARFEDLARKDRAMHDIHDFKAEKLSVQEYMDKFEEKRILSEVTEAEAYYLFRRGLPTYVLRDLLANNGTPPTTYNALKAWCTQYALNQETRKGILSALRGSAPQPKEKRTGSGVTYGGQGQPMEIDAQKSEMRCFNCGKKGHLKTECRGPKRGPGECYECGSKEHLVAGCAKRKEKFKKAKDAKKSGKTSRYKKEPTEEENEQAEEKDAQSDHETQHGSEEGDLEDFPDGDE
jgi:hypothetical protein